MPKVKLISDTTNFSRGHRPKLLTEEQLKEKQKARKERQEKARKNSYFI